MITTKELRQKYLDFFVSKNHAVIDGASLLPENDPTVLFTTAGMHPLVPYLMGEKHPSGNRLVNFQKCIRTGDIEEVGDDTHLTFFEMLGNWSLGNPASPDGIGQGGYFKNEAIEYSWEFLTSADWLGLDKAKLAVSVFIGDEDAPKDEESATVWLSLGVPEHKIAYLPKKNNWWGPAGKTGPCGPDTEMFYWVGEGLPPVESNPGNDEANWVEIWNDVFMQYYKDETGKYIPAQQKNVDTGMGLERTVAVLNGYKNVYEVDTLQSIYKKVELLAKDKANIRAIRIITDHVRAAVMIMGDDHGVVPSNVDQGYVVRRLLRTAIKQGREIGIITNFIKEVAQVVIDTMSETYQELNRNKQKIISEISIEEEKFSKVLNEGEKLMEKKFDDYMIKQGKSGMEAHNLEVGKKVQISNPLITPQEAFYLYSTYGIPKELIINFANKKNYVLDIDAFEKIYNDELRKHQELSRAGGEQKFAGGLADHSDEVKRLHTATHLLQAALRKVLGDHVAQKGSNITKDRLRFDFSHPEKMTPEQIKQVEDIVNDQINKKLKVWWTEMTVEEAKQKGALGLFTQKYGAKVKVYTVGDEDNWFSRELCGGPHVDNTAELVSFKISKEEASSAGVRRLKAVLGK